MTPMSAHQCTSLQFISLTYDTYFISSALSTTHRPTTDTARKRIPKDLCQERVTQTSPCTVSSNLIAKSYKTNQLKKILHIFH